MAVDSNGRHLTLRYGIVKIGDLLVIPLLQFIHRPQTPTERFFQLDRHHLFRAVMLHIALLYARAIL